MKIAAVADTHAALWYLLDDPRLSLLSRAFISRSLIARHKIAVASISLVEVVYLVERRRVPLSAYEILTHALGDPEHIFVEESLSVAIPDTLRRVSRTEVPDMPDRIVAATALHLAVPVISRDGRIRSSALETIW
jgi:PIN domain nuclease of toxin-antitoxin system